MSTAAPPAATSPFDEDCDPVQLAAVMFAVAGDRCDRQNEGPRCRRALTRSLALRLRKGAKASRYRTWLHVVQHQSTIRLECSKEDKRNARGTLDLAEENALGLPLQIHRSVSTANRAIYSTSRRTQTLA